MTGDREHLDQIVKGIDSVIDDDGDSSDSNKSGGVRITESERREFLHVVRATGDGWNGEESSPDSGESSSTHANMPSLVRSIDSWTSSFWSWFFGSDSSSSASFQTQPPHSV